MIAVNPSSRYQNLRDYVITNGSGGRPTGVRGFDQSARQPVDLPTGVLPGVKAPIPTSSARPGKATNQRIPYPRLCFNFSTTGHPLMKQEMQEGDISFVHRPTNSNGKYSLPGHGPNRASTIGNILQMNAMLSNHDPDDRGVVTMAATKPDPANPGQAIATDPLGVLTVPDYESTGRQRVDDAGRPKMRDTTWTERWADCSILGRWTPDGIIIGSEHQHGTPIPLTGSMESNPGDLWNICIQGPTPMKNSYVSPTDFSNAYAEQHIDSGPRVLDKIFVGLHATMHRDNTGQESYYSYSWKPFTSRQALKLDDDHFKDVVAVWRIGTIMDPMLAKGRMQVNVCVEEWSLDLMEREYAPCE